MSRDVGRKSEIVYSQYLLIEDLSYSLVAVKNNAEDLEEIQQLLANG